MRYVWVMIGAVCLVYAAWHAAMVRSTTIRLGPAGYQLTCNCLSLQFSRAGMSLLLSIPLVVCAFPPRSIMYRLIVFAVITIAAGSAYASEVPFFASPDVPDYTAKMITRDAYGAKGDRQRVVQHHNGWTRVEEQGNEETNLSYGHFFKNVVLRATRRNGEISSFEVRQVEPSQDYDGITEVRETDDVETVGGEQCRWRQIVRRMDRDKTSPSELTCLTEDGIEIATKVLFSSGEVMSETRLTDLRRGPVPEAVVRPPMQLLEAGTWLAPLPRYDDYTPNPGDFEAELVSHRSKERLLRHYPWWLRQRDRGDGSILITVWNELEDQGLQYSASKGERMFEAVRSSSILSPKFRRFDEVYGMVDLREQDRLLGEDCAWYDRTPNMADGGLRQCLTSDGIPLIDAHLSGWGDGEGFKIVTLTRRPVGVDEMQPPRDYLEPAAWGFSPPY
ncbi:hypothetical protein GGD57_005261 [Rhizobium esperanzae]|uniref:Uncharacterized protein n=2 Tax=Rhizobium esperanzae TaxID=1967781 RepID=A0A7W6W7G3_9HYPH|nr:hypothetical protein [Rhizobium esperanzae]